MAACIYGCGNTAIPGATVCESCAAAAALYPEPRPYTAPERRMSIQEAANELRACASDIPVGLAVEMTYQIDAIQGRAEAAFGESTARSQAVMEAIGQASTARAELEQALLYLQSELTAAANHHSQG